MVQILLALLGISLALVWAYVVVVIAIEAFADHSFPMEPVRADWQPYEPKYIRRSTAY